MAVDKLVDSGKLDACCAAEAAAIIAKGGGTAPLAYDFTNNKGFADAIEAIPSGGDDSVLNSILDRTISGSYTNTKITRIGANAFAYCSNLTTVSFPVCTSIGSYAFNGCNSLTTVSFPVCTSIGSYAFNGCYSLTTVSFPVCTSIGNYAFSGCNRLTTVSFPVCTSIGSYAFNGCYSLTTVSFPVCTSIGSYAFNGCYGLLSLYFLGSSIPTLYNVNVFTNTPISNYTTSTGGVHGSIIVKESMLDAFKTATNWSVYSSRFSVWNGVD